LEKVFEPYFSTKNAVNQKGLGMGLAICYSIVKKHEGHIAITSEVQKGTTVDMYLPAFDNRQFSK
jgi:signal transduction histidine kinase